MSLDELLKKNETSAAWKEERKKLIRIVSGISIIAIALVGGALMLSSLKKDKMQHDALALKQEQETKYLAELLRLQKETRVLQEDIQSLRQPASISSGQDKKPKIDGNNSDRTDGNQLPKGTTSRTQIINIDPGEGFVALDSQKKDIYIPTGMVFRARLITPIKTSVERTFVLAETTHEYRMDMKRKIPKGCRLIGRSHLNPILKGVIVEFDTLVLPNGIETSLSGLGLSRNALPEIDGLYFSNDLETYGGALAFGFLSGFADAARKRQPTVLGYSMVEESVDNQVLAGISTASFQVAEEILRDVRSRAIEYVVVPAGEAIFVALTKRYDLNQRDSK